VHRWGRDQRHRQWPVAERIGCIALRGGGGSGAGVGPGLLAAMETGLYALTLHDDGRIDSLLLHGVAFPQPQMRFNDGRTDRQGRFWVSSMVRDMGARHAADKAAGTLYRLDRQGFGPTAITGLRTGNGLAFSPDGRVMYLSDSHPTVRRIWAFDLDAEGQPTRQRLFVDMNQHPGRPDGAAVDADGGYWICANDAGLVHRFTPDGRLDRSIPVPAAKPSMCAFGGAGLDRLFVTTIAPAQPVAGHDPALAGAVFVLDPGCTGLAESPVAQA
jgi:sugar lactone lactonase YvrE